MGEVYRAQDTRLNRIVALKIARSGFSERFQREAQVISSFSHPKICTLFDIGHADGLDYFVMEHLEGETLRGPVPPDRLLRYAAEIAEGLDTAHRKGIVHRELSQPHRQRPAHSATAAA
jgi:serine/threonine protein kinase